MDNTIILRGIIATDDSTCLAAIYFIEEQENQIGLGCYDSSDTNGISKYVFL